MTNWFTYPHVVGLIGIIAYAASLVFLRRGWIDKGYKQGYTDRTKEEHI